MADRDVPAILDMIFETTGQDALYVAGQSMGTTIMFSMLSENHKYDKKVTRRYQRHRESMKLSELAIVMICINERFRRSCTSRR